MGILVGEKRINFYQSFVLSGISTTVATFFTHPIDLVKVRLQNDHHKSTAKQGLALRPFIRGFTSILKSDGILGFTGGLPPSLLRAMFYGGSRLSFYQPILELCPRKTTFYLGISSFLSACFANLFCGTPLEILKVQGQQTGARMSESARIIIQSHGVFGFWRGLVPASLRSGILTATQIVPYKFAKQAIADYTNISTPFVKYIIASLFAGLVTCTCTTPIDVIKTRVMTNPDVRPLNCLEGLIRKEGVFALFRGWNASYIRIGPQTSIIFIVYDVLRGLSGFEQL